MESGNDFSVKEGTSTRLTFKSGGNVGIGTTNPSKTLEVNGELKTAGNITCDGTTIFGGTSSLDINLFAAGSLTLKTDNTAALTIDSSQNVGIGTTNPAQHQSSNETVLHIADSNVASLNLDSTATNGDCYVLSSTGSGDFRIFNDDTNATVLNIDNTGNVGIGTASPDSKLQVKSSGSNIDEITLVHSGNTVKIAALGQESSHGSLHLRHNSGVNKVRLSAGGNSSYILDGNVGIGTTAPAGRLDVRKSQNTTAFTDPFLKLYPSSTTNTTGLTTITLGTSTVDNYGVSLNAWRSGTTGEPKFVIKTHNGSAAGSSVLTINNAGNVGIGTITPTAKLEISQGMSNGTNAFTDPHLRLTATNTVDTTGFVGMTMNTSSGGNYGYSMGAQRDSAGIGDFKINFHNNSASGVNRFIIDTSGRVGIGSTSPSAMVNAVSPNGNTNSLRLGRLDSTNYWDFNHAGNDLRIYNSAGSGSDILLGVNSGGAAQGNKVGIGTASPATALDVVGTIKNSSYTVSTLPSASPAGQRAFISDSAYSLSSSISYNSIGGGGSIFIPVYSDGTAWKAG